MTLTNFFFLSLCALFFFFFISPVIFTSLCFFSSSSPPFAIVDLFSLWPNKYELSGSDTRRPLINRRCRFVGSGRFFQGYLTGWLAIVEFVSGRDARLDWETRGAPVTIEPSNRSIGHMTQRGSDLTFDTTTTHGGSNCASIDSTAASPASRWKIFRFPR